MTAGALYSPVIWPDLGVFLADVELQVAPAQLGQQLAAIRTGLGLQPATEDQYPNVIEGPPGVACSDSDNPRALETWQTAADAAEAAYGRFGRLWNWSLSACGSWPTTASRSTSSNACSSSPEPTSGGCGESIWPSS